MAVFKGHDLIGIKVNKVTVLGYIGARFYACVCECGAFCKARSGGLRRGDKVSCGCTNRGQGSTLLSQEEFIQKAKTVHGDKYDYTISKYTKSDEVVDILCKVHGQFEQVAGAHMSGRGCTLCGLERSTIPRRKDKEEFITQAKEVHGDKYDYSNIEFVDSKTKINIFCKVCSKSFPQSPNSHLRGQGCKVCSRKALSHDISSNTEEFIKKAIKIHGKLYDYSLVKYKRSSDKVDLKCNRCESTFPITPNKHLIGRGCPHCAKCGFKKNKEAFLYILISDDITKVGITNDKPLYRASMVSSSSGKKFEVHEVYHFSSGKVCHETESSVLKYLRSNYASPTEKFHGYSECFYSVDRNLLKQQILRLKEMYE